MFARSTLWPVALTVTALAFIHESPLRRAAHAVLRRLIRSLPRDTVPQAHGEDPK